MGAKKGLLFVLIAGFVLVTMLALALAAKPAESDNGTDATGTAKEAKNMTYGQCVSEGAKIKNDCYGSVKSAYSSCKSNSTDTKTCNTGYKADMAQCKKDFKSTKNVCKKIKHNFMETLRYSLA